MGNDRRRRKRDAGGDTEALRRELASLEIRALDEEFRRRAEGDLLFFCRHVLRFKDLDDQLHGEVARIVCDTTQKKKLLLLPRGHLKSSLVTVGWSLWSALQDPNRTFGIFNEGQGLAEAFLREIREHLERNPQIRRYWPHVIPRDRRARLWTRSSIELNRTRYTRTPTFEAKSINESTAGRHPDVMVIDDPVSDKTVRTEDGIRNSKQKFQELQALLEPPSEQDPIRGTMIVIGTRWHWQDIYSFIIEDLADYWTVHIRRAIENGKVIFPKKFNHEMLRELRITMGEWTFSSQMMNEPVDSESAIFPPSLLIKRTWKGDRDHFLERVRCLSYLAVDPAWEGEDATGMVAGARALNRKLYLLESRRVKLQPDRMLEAVVSMAIRWRVQKIAFEGVIGGQEWLAKNLRDLLADQNSAIPVVTMSHGNRSKNARITGLVPELQYQRLYLHDEGCEELRTEMVRYPRGQLVDLLDATEMLCRIATPPSSDRELPAHRVPGTGEYEMAMMERAARRNGRRKGVR